MLCNCDCHCHLSLIMRKPIFRMYDHERLKPTCSATQTSKSHEIAKEETGVIILPRQQTTKALIRLCGCAGWSAPLLFAYGKNGVSHDVAHLIYCHIYIICLSTSFLLRNGPGHAKMCLMPYANNAFVQADQYLCCSLLRYCAMYTYYIQSIKILASFCIWAGWFECYLVENPPRHIFACCGSLIVCVL